MAVLTLMVLVLFQKTAGDTVHQTMVTTAPYGAGLDGVSVKCIRSSPDEHLPFSYSRPFKLDIPGVRNQTTTFPEGTTLLVADNTLEWVLPSITEAAGMYFCQGWNTYTKLTSTVYSIIHSNQRKFEPADGQVTKTVNKGENVTLAVIPANNGSLPLWHRFTYVGSRSNLASMQYVIQLSSGMVADGDFFVVTERDAALDDNHFGMIRLIIRGCVAGKWGPPDCAKVCEMCYNGGVCDDETGDCICPPGFNGPNCLTACGKHKFGWHCEYECGAENIIQSCTGSQFGLPDPYGNSCISGYYGKDCDTECSNGTFGAGCTQTCHCKSGTCDGFTGECTGSPECATGWSGSNCQIPDKCPVGYYGSECIRKCLCFNRTVPEGECDRVTGECSTPTEPLNVVLLAAIGGGILVVLIGVSLSVTFACLGRNRRQRHRTKQRDRRSNDDSAEYENNDAQDLRAEGSRPMTQEELPAQFYENDFRNLPKADVGHDEARCPYVEVVATPN
ncbi:tyrosine-protein kinase receptor Tie-1-like isoform X2 [Acanthaster planci]|uniref:Tyrosine-protein kinase receptor Tie-1-like isoform X2 n=1 Tax=Acanthaster planci TaxID=133434 RepID=A0A8B7Z3Q7_ACAPL|nr:tyrosine-protein kinase receptor Tie-1-like isoform X2 [Acanthaster planci]